MSAKVILMLGTDLASPGGITAVVSAYLEGGLMQQWPVQYLATFRRDRLADKVLTAARALLVMVGLLARGKVAVVHTHSAARASFWRKSLFLLLGKWAGARTVLHIHSGLFPDYYEKACGRLRKPIVRWILRSMDRVVVLSSGWQVRLKAIEPAARLVVIPNPAMSAALPRDRRAGEILFLGRLRQDKGIDDLVDAAAMLLRDWPQAYFVCAGDGDRNRLGARLNALGIADRFSFPGWVGGEKKEKLLARAALLVLPSYVEGLPMCVLEAMSHGVPVVASRVGGIPEAIGDAAGLLVTPGDVQGLAGALAQLMCDEALSQQLGAAGMARARRLYSIEAVLDALGALYASLGVSVIMKNVPFCAPSQSGAAKP